MHGLSDNSVRSVLSYVLYGFTFARAFNLSRPLVLNGGSLGTSMMEHLNKISDSKINHSLSHKLTFLLPGSIC